MIKIQIDGTNTRNKGAELMLYSVLEAIESKYPNSTVYFNAEPISDSKKIVTSLNFKRRTLLDYARYPKGILSRLKLPYTIFTEFYPSNGINLVLDAGGFRFGDQWMHTNKYFDLIEKYYEKLKSQGTYVFFLPQAFGPFNTISGKRSVKILDKYIDLIFARDPLSYKYILESGIKSEKVSLYPDFTNLTKGIISNKYNNLKDAICIIPNNKMITHTKLDSPAYLKAIVNIIDFILKSGKNVFLLNHEGNDDFEICYRINQHFQHKLQIVDNLNAKEVKGIIGASYFTVSSRFHGIASALSQSIPCVATSWSHKYEYLFKDFGLMNKMIDCNNEDEYNIDIIKSLIDHNKNLEIRNHLKSKNIELKVKTEKMWNEVWQKFEG